MSNSPVFALRTKYLRWAACLFLAEILIAYFVRDRFIRPVGGDFLIVIFLYCLVRGVTNFGVFPSATGVLLFAFLIEISQYFHLVNHLDIAHFTLARVVMGTQFSWEDIAAYTAGIIFILGIELKSSPLFRKWNTL